MDKIKNVMIVGLGALGTLYADAFQNTEGVDVFVLVDEERKERYTRNPRTLRGNPVEFNYVLPCKTNKSGGERAAESNLNGECADTDNLPNMDFILICTKSGGMYEAIDMIEGFVGEETIIASLMNGVSCEELLAERYGKDHVLHMIYLGDGVQNFGGNVNDVDKNTLFFGSVDNPRGKEQIPLVDELFAASGIRYHAVDDMLYAFWRKFLLICSYNQACALFNSDYSVFFNVPEAVEFVKNIIRECLPIAEAAGVKNTEELFDDLVEVASKIVPDCMPSITQDRIEKRRMEVDIFADEIIRRGRALGIPTPYNDRISEILNIINKQNGFD